MALVYNPGVLRNGLVAYYNPSSEASLPGNGINLVTNTDLITGWDRTGYNTGIIQNDGPNPPGVAASFNNFSFYDNDTNRNSYWYSYGDFVPGKVQGALYRTKVWTKTRDRNFAIAMYTADNSEAGRVFGDYPSIPGDQQWYHPTWTWQNPTNSQSASLSFQYSYGNPQGETQRSWLCLPEIQRITQLVDLSGNRNNCTLGTTVGYNNWRNGSLQMNSGDTTSRVDSSMALGSKFPVDAAWTWSVWARATSVPATTIKGVIIGATSYGGAAIYWYSNGTNITPFGFLRQTSAYRNTTFGSMTTNRWHHLTMVNSRASTNFSFYMDGVLIGSAGRDNTAYNNGAAGLTWGISKPDVDGGGSDTYRSFPGTIGEIMLYDVEQTQAEIAANYQAQRTKYGV
jgi:Concanavalin A-like lectin/glucanases superfamily